MDIKRTKKQNSAKLSPNDCKKITWRKWLILAGGCGVLLTVIICVIIFNSESILTKKKAQSIMDDTVDQTLDLIDEENLLHDLLSENLSTTVLSVERSDKSYQVNCLITSVDCADVLIDYLSSVPVDEFASGNDIIRRLEAVVENAPTVEKEFVIEFVKTDYGYAPIFTEEIVSYCSGNMQEAEEYLMQLIETEKTK